MTILTQVGVQILEFGCVQVIHIRFFKRNYSLRLPYFKRVAWSGDIFKSCYVLDLRNVFLQVFRLITRPLALNGSPLLFFLVLNTLFALVFLKFILPSFLLIT